MTPNRTSDAGPAIRFRRRSRGSRSGFAEDFVGVEAAEFFGEAVFEAAAGQGDALCGLAGLGQFGDGEPGRKSWTSPLCG